MTCRVSPLLGMQSEAMRNESTEPACLVLRGRGEGFIFPSLYTTRKICYNKTKEEKEIKMAKSKTMTGFNGGGGLL